MKITKKWLEEKRACCSENDMDRAEKELKGDVKLITDTLLKEDRFNDANWLLTKLMNKKQCVEYAVFAAKQVLGVFEKKHPNDKKPRKAAAYAYAYAAYAAAAAYAANAANAASYAAAAASDVKTKIIKYGIKILN